MTERHPDRCDCAQAICPEWHKQDEELCPEPLACPNCKERRIDLLEWTEDENLICNTCDTKYSPNKS